MPGQIILNYYNQKMEQIIPVSKEKNILTIGKKEKKS